MRDKANSENRKQRKAKNKLIRLLNIAVLKWFTWCLVHQPYDFKITAEEFNRLMKRLLEYEGNLYDPLIKMLQDSRDRAQESKNSTS